MKFDDKYFVKFGFTEEQVKRNIGSAERDLDIAVKDEFRDVKFNYAYTALLKAGIALLSFHGRKVKSAPGHHVKILEKLAEMLGDEGINDMGNVMRAKRNTDLYEGGIDVTCKEVREYISFVQGVLGRVRGVIGYKA